MLRRMMMITGFMMMLLLCVGFASNLDGTWEGKVQGPNGDEVPLTFTFKVDGDKLSGKVESAMGELPITDGKVNGDEFSFNTKLGDDTITHEGKVTGDTITLKAHGPWGDLEMTLKRATPKEEPKEQPKEKP
jgi:hypothetical protein